MQHPSEEEIAKVLGEPVGFDVSETAAKLRRNLLLVSTVVVVLIVGEIQPGADFSVFGVTLTGVTPFKLMLGLAIVLAYNLVHFLWYCYELYSEWAIRLTGTRLTFITGARYGALGADYPDNPKQSTLYNWWMQEARSMSAYSELLTKVSHAVEDFQKNVDDLQKADMTMAGTVSGSIQRMENTLAQVRGTVEKTESIVTNTRIPVSLSRFDNRFKMLLKSQNLRVFFIEIGMPLSLAMFAATLLVRYFLPH